MSSKEKNLQIFIAKLNPRVREKDLDRLFSKYGNIKNILIKSGYAFIEYDNYKDAEDAVRHMDGKTIEGQRIVVEHASKLILNYTEGKRHERSERTRSRERNRSDSRDRRRRDNSSDRRDRRTNSDGGFIRKKGPQSDDVCFNCGKTGHWSNECRDPVKSKGQYFKDDSKCYKCGEKGHIQRNCKRSRSRSRSVSKSRSRSRSRSHSKNNKKKSSRKRSESSRSRTSNSVSRSHSKEIRKSEERKTENGVKDN